MVDAHGDSCGLRALGPQGLVAIAERRLSIASKLHHEGAAHPIQLYRVTQSVKCIVSLGSEQSSEAYQPIPGRST